jgi:D-alanyl-D-alanine carboxypeptidase-like protein
MSALQEEFAQSAAKLIQKAAELGYTVTFGEAWRTPEQAQWNADHHLGVAHSLHMERLAVDLNVFKDGAYQADDSNGCYSALGAWWKTLGDAYRWGGDFKLVDLDHFSITPDGVRA